jgi:DnaJ like chaperone protein
MLGKLLGAMIGASLGMVLAWSPPLAAILGAVGALIGHFVVDREPVAPRAFAPPSKEELLGRAAPKQKREPRKVAPPTKPKAKKISADDLLLVDSLCPLFVEVARADSPPVQLEIRVIREFFEQRLQFNEIAMEAVRDALKDAIAAPEQDIEFLTTRARTAVKPSIRVEVVRSLYDLGLVDGQLQRSEQDMLKRIVGQFNLSDEQLQQITAEYFGKGDQEYELLGITRDATDDEVKSAFRKLAAEHHPDRARDDGKRFREVKDAYEALKKLRGF